MHHAIDTLRHEHEAITLGLRLLARMDHRIAAGQTVDTQDLSALVDFLKAFADTCHHGKEEKILFPAMKAEDLEQTQAPIERMLEEHAHGRQLLADLQAALAPSIGHAEFHKAARAYTALLLAHIEKENTILFPMASRLLSSAQQSQLADAFEAYENKVMGPGQHDALHTTLKNLVTRYPE